MCSTRILLPLLAASAPLCSSFAPQNRPSVHHRACASVERPCVLRAAPSGDEGGIDDENNRLERAGTVAGSALVALTLSFSALNAPVPFSDGFSTVPPANALPSITLAKKTAMSPDDEVIRELEEETKKEEKLAKKDAKKARVELGKEKFFEYEARMAEQTEARIEAAEKKAEVEFEKDREEAEKLMALERKAEKEAELAQTKAEKLAKQKEAKALLKKEREFERKEKKAERAERVFLAEEKQEQKILRQKEDAAIAEEKKFEEVEKEYEAVAELAKEEEMELSLLKGLSSRK